MRKHEVIHDDQGRVICGAKTRSGGRCQNPPVTGRHRCRMHGGSVPVGVASPSFRHGRHSRHVPHSLRHLYEAARADPDALALGEELALLDTRLNDLLGRLDAGETGRLWLQLKAAYTAFQAAKGRGDVVGMNAQLEVIDRATKRGAAEALAWQEVGDVIERRRRVVETEMRRRIAMSTMVTPEKLDLLMAHIVRVVEESVDDDTVLQRISAGLARVIGSGEGREPP